jgi:flagellar hook-basal body complex protein FliE
MSIPPISGISAAMPAAVTQPPQTMPVSDGGAGFGTSLASAVDGLQAMQSTSSALAIKAVTGDLSDVHDYTIAATQASVAMELTATIRNRAVDAFNEIMRMQA